MVQPLTPGVGEVLETRPEEQQLTGEPDMAHIVRTEGDAAARVLEARVNGTPLEALCGVVFVPQRDPSRLPMCSVCKDIYDTYRAFNEGFPETPRT